MSSQKAAMTVWRDFFRKHLMRKDKTSARYPYSNRNLRGVNRTFTDSTYQTSNRVIPHESVGHHETVITHAWLHYHPTIVHMKYVRCRNQLMTMFQAMVIEQKFLESVPSPSILLQLMKKSVTSV